MDGDADAFGILFRRHRDRLWAVALRTMSNPEDAADGLQDGMIAAYRRAGSFRGDAAVTTWLHRVVVNACLDRLRAAKVRRAEPLPDDLDGDVNLVLVAFQRQQQAVVDGWLPTARALAAERPALRFYEMPTIGRGYVVIRPIITKGMRNGVTAEADREATIFAHADYAVIGDLHEIVPAITAELRKVRGS